MTTNEIFVILLTMNKRKNSAEKIVDRFGGQSSLADLLGRRQSTVQHWVKTGMIPTPWHQPLLKLARKKGIALGPDEFVTREIPVIEPAEGRLGVLLVGLGAVSSTFIAGVEHIRRGTGQPFRVGNSDGDHPAGQADGKKVAFDKGFCSVGRS